jgi:hypothetical protein
LNTPSQAVILRPFSSHLFVLFLLASCSSLR